MVLFAIECARMWQYIYIVPFWITYFIASKSIAIVQGAKKKRPPSLSNLLLFRHFYCPFLNFCNHCILPFYTNKLAFDLFCQKFEKLRRKTVWKGVKLLGRGAIFFFAPCISTFISYIYANNSKVLRPVPFPFKTAACKTGFLQSNPGQFYWFFFQLGGM